jgi:hypothetical protein
MLIIKDTNNKLIVNNNKWYKIANYNNNNNNFLKICNLNSNNKISQNLLLRLKIDLC